MTVVQGDNDTGKSSLLKSIYWTLGAEPAVTHPHWKSADAVSLLRLEIDGNPYTVVRAKSRFGLFNGKDRRLGVYDGVTQGFGPVLAKLLDLEITLTSREGEVQVAPPAYQLLPFYVDQDIGWSKQWASFANLSQFSSWKKDVVQYHVGIRPADWYKLKSRLQELAEQVSAPRAELDAVERLLKSAREDVRRVNFDLDLDAYRKEIDELVAASSLLARRERKYGQQLMSLQNERLRLEEQLKVVSAARRELTQDFEYLAEHGETADCPTCGATYANSFVERFSIASDENRCLELELEICADLEGLARRIENSAVELDQARSLSTSIRRNLESRRGALSLREILEKEGTKQLVERLIGQRDELHRRLGELSEETEEAKNQLADLDSPERTTAVHMRFRDLMREHLGRLNVGSLPEERFKAVESSIQETGSDLPRALLAYTFSILKLISTENNARSFPIVIDAPNQQEQDQKNLRSMLEFISQEAPSGAQVILGLVDDAGVLLSGNRVRLDRKYGALSEAEFVDASKDLGVYLSELIGAESTTDTNPPEHR